MIIFSLSNFKASQGLTGENRDHVIIVGAKLDWAGLTVSMRNKIRANTVLLWIEDFDWAEMTASLRNIGGGYGGGDGCSIM